MLAESTRLRVFLGESIMIYKQKWFGSRIHNGKKSDIFFVEVPGNIQYDYALANGFNDVYFSNGCKQFDILEDDEWEYSTKLNYSKKDDERVWFVSHGIDYKFKVFLNNEEIFENEGMFSPINLDLTDKLTGDDTLTVRIAPHPKREGVSATREQADHSCKPPFCYGWDWNPRLLISGLYRDTYIETRNDGFVENPEVFYELSEDLSIVDIRFSFECQLPCRITLLDDFGNTVYEGEDTNFKLNSPKLWWCNGEGEPTLYTYRIENEKYSTTGIVGFRRTRLLRNVGAVETGGFPLGCYDAPITLELNGRRIFMKGSNFVNADIFPGRVTEERYFELIKLAKDANMNIFRMWGGSGPMPECFYDICDRLGILVWQEFMLACNDYPDDSHYLSVLEKEGTSIIKSIRRHPCLSLWCGGNELFNGWSGMDEQSLPLRLLDKLCYENDKNTPFIKTSPIMGMAHGGYVFYDKDKMGGDVFTSFQRANKTAYTEFGVPSIAPLDVLEKIIPKDEIFPINGTESYILHHAKGAWGKENWACVDILEHYFGRAESVYELIFESNLLQCEGYKAAFEEARRQWPHCSAAINWVYNEPWYTAANNSILTYPQTPKPSYYAIKSSLRPTIFSARIPKFDYVDGEKFKAEIWLLNDSNQSVVANARVYLKIGDTSINLLENIKTECSPKSNVECATVCCVLPEIPNAGIMTLVIESNGDYSSEYKLKYEYKRKIVKPKILNDF